MSWTDIPNASLEPGAPARSVDAISLRDNIIHVRDGNNKLVVFTASGTYTKPAGLRRVKVTLIAGGGGAGTTAIPAVSGGGTSSFGSHCSATGGAGRTTDEGNFIGGVGSGGDINLSGGVGSSGGTTSAGGTGAVFAINGSTATVNTAAYGYGTGGCVSGGGSGGGGGAIKTIDASALGATETVTVGSGGDGGSTYENGAPGIVIIEEFY